MQKDIIASLINKLSDGLYEKEEVISLTLLCALAGKSVFLYGPPGTAKSLIVRRVASAFKYSKYFGQLMNRFTTPEDVFGPVSLSKLKEDKFERQTEGYLPKADFVFLDEIWKSSPAILNTLLTIINEKVYRNGSVEEKVPLKALVAASNETPPKGQGLEAMYDRFIMRLFVDTAKKIDNFKSLIVDKDVSFDAGLKEEEKISTEDWLKFNKEIDNVSVSDEVLNIICYIKNEIDEYNKGNNEAIYISDRRWKNIVYILKAAAFFSDRNTVMPIDCFLISYCIWTLEENIEAVKKIVLEAIKFFSTSDINIFDEKIEDIKNSYKSSLNNNNTNSNSKDLEFETVTIKGKKFVKLPVQFKTMLRASRIVNSLFKSLYPTLYNSYNVYNVEYKLYNLYATSYQLNTNSHFNPYYEDGTQCEYFECIYLGNGKLKITKNQNIYDSDCLIDENGNEVSETTCTLPVKKKNIINSSSDNSEFKKECSELIDNINNFLNGYENYLTNNIDNILSIFLSDENNRLMLKIYNENISELKSKVIELEKIRESLK